MALVNKYNYLWGAAAAIAHVSLKLGLKRCFSLSNICAEMLLVVIALKALIPSQNASWARKQPTPLVLSALPALAVIERLMRNLPLYFGGGKSKKWSRGRSSKAGFGAGWRLVPTNPPCTTPLIPGSLGEASLGTHLVLPGGFRHLSPRSESHHCCCLRLSPAR